MAARAAADPRAFIAQETIQLLDPPDLDRRGLRARHIDLRPFVLQGQTVEVLPGRSHARRAAGGQPHRQLVPGRRLQGHLGARADARPSRRGPVLDRALPRARRGHRAAAQRHLPHDAGGDHPRCRAGEPWSELLTLLYLDEEGEGIDRERVARFVVADRTNPGSIASLVGRARDNARGVREWLTTELWEEINSFYLELASMDLARALEARPYAVCELVRRRCETVIGVATVAMPRTEGYQFMTLGQLLERAGITARLLAVWHRRMLGMGGTAGFVEWTKVLRSASAYEAYLREHHAMFDGSRVIPFLLGPGSCHARCCTASRSPNASWSRSRAGRTADLAASDGPGPLRGRVRRARSRRRGPRDAT